MKRTRRNLKKGSGRAFLSLLLVVALTMGSMTTAFATEDAADAETTEETTETAETQEKVDAAVSDRPADTAVTEASANASGKDAAKGTAIESDGQSAEEGQVQGNASVKDEQESVSKDADQDASYGLYGGYDGSDSLDDPDKAGASVGWDVSVMSAITSKSGLWWIDDYYVGETDKYNTEKTDDFSLKYQIEFHASEDIAAEGVKIIIDASLGTYRDGTNIIPSELGIPYGTPDDYTTSSSSPFNYYYVDQNGKILTESQAKTAEGVQIVVWNYRDIVSGSNAVFQVLYRDLDIMNIVDGTKWSLGVKASVTVDEEEESVTGNTLTGDVDTSVWLASVTKKAHVETGYSYTPEIYTEYQMSRFIDNELGEPYASNFDSYIYIVWEVTFRGTATQPYTITINENTFTEDWNEKDLNGSVVGYKPVSQTNGVSYNLTGSTTDGDLALTYSSASAKTYTATFYVVTAYDAAEYEYEADIENDVSVKAHPVDNLDEDITKETSATTTWGEYEWRKEGSGPAVTIDKYATENNDYREYTYSSYLTLYEINRSKGEDTGPFYYHTKSTAKGYEFTYYTEGSQLGQHIDGSYYTTITADDAIYLYVNEETAHAPMLTKDDYYFSSVDVVVEDIGYDFWEDAPAPASRYEDVDQKVYIYAMFTDADETQVDAEGWELAGTVGWDESGVMSYTFTEEQIAREPYRVKAEHATADYESDCTITVGMTLRADSPTLSGYIEELGDDFVKIQLDNVSGVSAQTDDVVNNGDYFQGATGEEVAYQKFDAEGNPTLTEFNKNLYGANILLRDYAENIISHLEETASAYKGVTTENDVANSRVLANYTITAYEGYLVSEYSSVEALEEAGISLPERHQVAYYDLLPYGMQFNADATVTAGRITTMNSSGTWRTNPNAWSTDGVTVTVNEDDVITNWNNTGRTMVIFHITYDGDDASAFYNNIWYEGFGISFQAYYDWADMNTVDAEYNIAAYIVEDVKDESQQLLGAKDGEIWKDDGSVDLAAVGQQYEPFAGVSDLNGDDVTDLYTNMYASTSTMTNVATAGTTSITKRVRADDDAVADYWSRAVVGYGENYTYEITLQNWTGDTLSDVVLFDRLEYAVEDGRNSVETSPDSVFSGLDPDEIDNHWTGTFLGVTTEALTEMGIAAVVYYNANRNATISSEDGATTPADVLTEANDWYTEERFIEVYGSLDAVKAVAVDISKMADGSAFIMDQDTTVSFQIHLKAPTDTDCSYAFNNPSYYSTATDSYDDSVTHATVIGDTARVQIGEPGTLEVTKYFDDKDAVPDSMKNQSFTFVLTRNDDILAGIEYMVYEWDEDSEEWVSTGVIRSTDISGRFTIKANQKAVFSQIVDVEDVTVREVEDPMWSTTEERDDSHLSDHELAYTYTNTYRSPVYLYKTVLTTGNASEEELANAEFTFTIYVDTNRDGEYEIYANGDYIYVKEVLTDGSSPAIDTSKGESGYGKTNDKGEVTLKIGDIIAFYPCDEDGKCIDVPYKIVETATGDAWTNMDNDTVEGTTSDFGTSETIMNYYKYRNLILTKSLEDYDQDESECTDSWTFKLMDADGKAVTGNHWYMIDANGDPVYTDVEGEQVPVEGYLDANGEFTFIGAGSGRRVVIEGLIEGEEYTLTETNYNKELYETVNDGTASATMPIYAINRSIEITNEYRLKDLSVSKLVLSKDTSVDVSSHTFTFTLEKKQEDGTYAAQASVPYTIDGSDEIFYTDENGQFTLTSGQTALFDDIGYMEDIFRVTETADGTYPQIYPANGEPYESALGSDGASVQFINGDFEEVVSITKNLHGLDDIGSTYVDLVKGDNTAATLAGEEKDTAYTVEVTLGIYGKDGNCVTSAEGSLIEYVEGNTGYPYVYIYITADGDVTLQSYNGGVMTVTLYPYDHIYLAEIGDSTVQASESEDLTRILFDVTDSTAEEIGSGQILSEGDVMSGSASADEAITLVNDISSAKRESEIYKLMTETSSAVPTGAQITFIVEIYDGSSGTWLPASGIPYITMDGYEGGYDTSACWPTSGVLTTGSDGKITLVKGDTGYPFIRFTEDAVYANVYEGMSDGTLRIVEISNGIDDTWGYLVGYGSEEWIDGPALNIPYADTFYNGNDSKLVFEVEKEMETSSGADAEFTFHLVQVISSSTSPITSMDQIQESEVGANISYIIYDAETGRMISEGTTDENGCFTLQPGQYAQFQVPTDTVWYVYEGVNLGYPLESVVANDDPNSTDKWGYADNASIVDDVNGVVQNTTSAYATGTIILTLTDSEDSTPLAGGTFDLYKDGQLLQSGLVTDANGQITVKALEPGTYYLEETAAPGGYSLADPVTTDEVTIPTGLTEITIYELTMENDPATVKYAVKVWGIRTDTYSYNNGATTATAGLTFGPALGADYTNSYKAHLTKEQYDAGEGYCIHWMSWDEIIAQSKEDPTVFADCKTNGCTKAVGLDLNEELGNETTIANYLAQGYSGDGVTTLKYLINHDSTSATGARWNNSVTGYSASDPANVYSRSRIRATLTGDGQDAVLQVTNGGNDYYGVDTLLDENNCLFSCFPANLQSAIVPRTTENAGNPSSGTSIGDKTTYDKLWLFSYTEIGATYQYDDAGGTDYGIATSSSQRKAYEFSNANATSTTGVAMWSRSRSSLNYQNALSVSTSGGTSSNGVVTGANGLSPCFSIE